MEKFGYLGIDSYVPPVALIIELDHGLLKRNTETVPQLPTVGSAFCTYVSIVNFANLTPKLYSV